MNAIDTAAVIVKYEALRLRTAAQVSADKALAEVTGSWRNDNPVIEACRTEENTLDAARAAYAACRDERRPNAWSSESIAAREATLTALSAACKAAMLALNAAMSEAYKIVNKYSHDMA